VQDDDVEYGSENRANLDSIKIKSQHVRVVFWNVENLYDPYDDTTRLDDEFTTAGARHWNYSRFSLKLNHVAKTLLSAGGWEAPVIVGLCEVENRYVLNKLIYETPLKTWKYRFIHHDSPDLRGVDVALLYRPSVFKPVSSRCVAIRYPFDTLSQTREILLVTGILAGKDTLSVFVNHFPSRRGGSLGSQPRRKYVASVLRGLADSILRANPKAGILIMGDFNDEPENESLERVLNARCDTLPLCDTMLYNLMGIRNRIRPEGTLKFRDQWSTFDQFIVSGALMTGSSGLKAGYRQAGAFRSGFLLEEDNTWLGEKLNRTYTGPKYHGGFSDHLPVRLDIMLDGKRMADGR
jgi:predicted extracellular nuclease